jgi:hypothetical protein
MSRFVIHYESPVRNEEEGRHVLLQMPLEAPNEAEALRRFKQRDTEGCVISEIEPCSRSKREE